MSHSNCRTGCATQDHSSWGECARSANLQIGPADRNSRQQFDRDNLEYRRVRKQGLQPKSINRPYVEAAKRAAGA